MRPERGFALVAALFVMVVVALVVATMSRLSVTQTASVDLALQQARAYQAARAGIEWGMHHVLADASPLCREESLTLPLDGFSVRVSCRETAPLSLAEEGSRVVFYTIEAEAWTGKPGSPDYAWRRLESVLERSDD